MSDEMGKLNKTYIYSLDKASILFKTLCGGETSLPIKWSVVESSTNGNETLNTLDKFCKNR